MRGPGRWCWMMCGFVEEEEEMEESLLLVLKVSAMMCADSLSSEWWTRKAARKSVGVYFIGPVFTISSSYRVG